MEKETYCVYYEVAEMDHEKVVPIVLDNINYWRSLFSIDKVAKKAKIMGKIFDLKKNIQMFSDLRHMTGHGITELMCESFEYEVYFKNSQIPDTVVNEKTGNESTRLTSKPIGFKLIGAGFYVNDYPKHSPQYQ